MSPTVGSDIPLSLHRDERPNGTTQKHILQISLYFPLIDINAVFKKEGAELKPKRIFTEGVGKKELWTSPVHMCLFLSGCVPSAAVRQPLAVRKERALPVGGWVYLSTGGAVEPTTS